MDNREFYKKIEQLQLIAYDFDGVMTNNCVYIDENGLEQVRVNRSDGYAISQIKRLIFDRLFFIRKRIR